MALHDEDEESLRLIDETPREMLDDDLHAEAAASPDRHAQEPIRVVSAEFMLNVEVDPKVIVTGIAEVRPSTYPTLFERRVFQRTQSISRSLSLRKRVRWHSWRWRPRWTCRRSFTSTEVT